MGLWGFELEDERDPVTGERDSTFVYCEDTEWSFGLVIARLLATPLTLTLDCVTAPVQAFLWGDDDDDESPGQACK